MIRTLLSLPVILIVLVLGGLYIGYGEVEPCRVLAIERARRAAIQVPGTESWMRLGTSQMSTPDCARGLLDSWRERLFGGD
jgi:hypothetical protein